MRKMNKFLAAICTAGMLLSLSPAVASAEEYTYTVTFDAGNQASMSGTAGLAVNNSATGSSYHVGGGCRKNRSQRTEDPGYCNF